MFHLIKKDNEKEKDGAKKEKKEKRDKKERMTQAELKSLEEMSVRRGFFNLHRGSTKKDSKSKLEISSPIPIKVANNTELSLMDIKGHMSTASSSDGIKGDGQFPHHNSVKERAAKFSALAKQNSPKVRSAKSLSLSQRSKEGNPSAAQNSTTTPSPEIDPQHRRGNQFPGFRRKRVHIPEVVEKTFPGADLQLPVLVPPPLPEPRELELQRRNTGDFGFSLRRTTMLDRRSDGGVYRRVVHFAEPGAGTKDLSVSLVAGDRLVEINGINVENKSRDEIVEMIRQSGESVRLKVQPIVELSELNRCWLRTSEGLHTDLLDVSTL